MSIKWSDDEIKILAQYENTAKSVYVLYQEVINSGYNRTYKAVQSKIETMPLRKPERYKSGRGKKIGYFDIEASGLVGNFAIMLSWAIKRRDENEVLHSVIRKEDIMSGLMDARLVEELMDAMRQFDVLCTFYGTRYDIPFSRTRAATHGIAFPHYREMAHKDIYYQIRRLFKLHSNALASACEFFGIAGKTRLKPEIWRKAQYGDEKSLKYILKHNIADVRILERLHKKIERYNTPIVQPM
jgi:uncharacterized protein YprB with RNaseH-like and TPR domain